MAAVVQLGVEGEGSWSLVFWIFFLICVWRRWSGYLGWSLEQFGGFHRNRSYFSSSKPFWILHWWKLETFQCEELGVVLAGFGCGGCLVELNWRRAIGDFLCRHLLGEGRFRVDWIQDNWILLSRNGCGFLWLGSEW